jgi:hypothetical protein
MTSNVEAKTPSSLFTSARMSAIWRLAKGSGFNTMKDFWGYADEVGWDFYDVLQKASP